MACMMRDAQCSIAQLVTRFRYWRTLLRVVNPPRQTRSFIAVRSTKAPQRYQDASQLQYLVVTQRWLRAYAAV
jgi:hypothetical protein